jgi:hypothetical protein
MKLYHSSEHGQALVIIAVAMIGLVAITGLAIDGSVAYSNRRHAQNAADTAALAGALAKVRGQDIVGTAQTRANSNGFDNDGVQNTVIVNSPPAAGCDGNDGPYAGNNEYVQVIIRATTETYFAPVVGITELNNCVEAITRAQPPTVITPFNGNAIVGLNPNGFSYDAWGNSEWYIHGGGVFSNGDAQGKNNKDNVHFPDGHCVTSVGTASYFSCPVSSGNIDMFYHYPDDIIPLLPPIPPCDGVAFRDTDGKLHEQVGKEGRGSVVDHFEDNFAPGLYCITETGVINVHGTITGTGVTFYILSTNFSLKFDGGGGMAVQAPTSGTYKGVLMFSNVTATPCTQNIEFRGNGTGDNVGTIFMPSACIDARGNSGASQNDSQIIGYTVSSNGSGDVEVFYNADNNYEAPIPPKIQLTK